MLQAAVRRRHFERMMTIAAFAIFLAFRILSVFVVKSWFVPDEYWQCLEVGHKLAFGYGYMTWEWHKGIRSYLHPLCISALYRAFAWFNIDRVDYLVLGPRILQAILSAASDYCFFRWNNRTQWSAFLIISSWFWFYMATRTLSNTVETCLTTIALHFFPRYRSADSSKFLWMVALLCFMRPTAAIHWVPLCWYHIQKSIHPVHKLLLTRYLPIGLIVGTISIAIDSYAHGALVVTPLEFFKANIVENIGSFYGSLPWHWYFIIGLPTVLGAFTIPFLFAVAQTVKDQKVHREQYVLLLTVLFSLCVYSVLVHKEFRFILPLLPMCLSITADWLTKWSRSASRLAILLVALILLMLNALPAVYLSLVHQRGTIDVMHSVERIAREYRNQDNHRATFLFLMPCHSTPFYSHVHQNVTMRFLTCEPNFDATRTNYLDEADQFYANPSAWLQTHISTHPKLEKPSHVILFDQLQPQIDKFLSGYTLLETISHSKYVSGRIGHNVLLFERERPLSERQTADFHVNGLWDM